MLKWKMTDNTTNGMFRVKAQVARKMILAKVKNKNKNNPKINKFNKDKPNQKRVKSSKESKPNFLSRIKKLTKVRINPNQRPRKSLKTKVKQASKKEQNKKRNTTMSTMANMMMKKMNQHKQLKLNKSRL